jgi:uncharacterized protein
VRRRGPGRGDDRRAPQLALATSAELAVRVQARAGRNEIVGERAGRLLVRVTAPPVEGRANAAVCKLIAKRAKVASGTVAVIRGERAREKTVRVEGLSEAVVRERLLG